MASEEKNCQAASKYAEFMAKFLMRIAVYGLHAWLFHRLAIVRNCGRSRELHLAKLKNKTWRARNLTRKFSSLDAIWKQGQKRIIMRDFLYLYLFRASFIYRNFQTLASNIMRISFFQNFLFPFIISKQNKMIAREDNLSSRRISLERFNNNNLHHGSWKWFGSLFVWRGCARRAIVWWNEEADYWNNGCASGNAIY